MKIKILNNIKWAHHRSGWAYVLSTLQALEDESGILVDGCIDTTFNRNMNKYYNNIPLPYKKEWIGFIHNPATICPWYNTNAFSPETILLSDEFQRSIETCRGVFTLSEHLAKHVRDIVKNQVKVEALYHPTETSGLDWDYNSFIQDRKIVQIGHWMRRLTTFFRVKVETYQKYYPLTDGNFTLKNLYQEITFFDNVSKEEFDSVIVVEHLANEEFDELLSESIVFLDLYDSSANNTIIECIDRNIPIIVNKIPAVVEYLGEAYPLYFKNADHIEELLSNDKLIIAAHLYLKNELDKTLFTGSYFLQAFKNSNILSACNF